MGRKIMLSLFVMYCQVFSLTVHLLSPPHACEAANIAMECEGRCQWCTTFATDIEGDS